MRSTQTSTTVPLDAVKPFERLFSYRARCLELTRAALQGAARRRTHSPIDGARLEPYGSVEGFEYLQCPSTGSLFLAQLPPAAAWAGLLAQVSAFRHSPEAFHSGMGQVRSETVYLPKVEWMRDALRLQGICEPRVLEVVTPPSDLTPLLRASGICAGVMTVDETALAQEAAPPGRVSAEADVAVLLESLDRADDPAALLRAVAGRLVGGGLIFVTALVCSGFDLAVLGRRNAYLYPPDRTNCFSLQGLCRLLEAAGCGLLEVSTPGVLDLEIVQRHLAHDPTLPLSPFERRLVEADADTRQAFQTFLQQQGLSSFARIVARRR